MGRARLHYNAGDLVKPRVDFFTFTWVFESCNLYNTERHTQFKFTLGFILTFHKLDMCF